MQKKPIVGYIFMLFITITAFFKPAYSQELDQNVLDQILATANEICDDYWRSGSESKLDLTGEAKVGIKGILSNIAELEVAGSSGFDSNEYFNVIRDQLGPELKSVRDCKSTIWSDLKDHLKKKV